MKKRTYAALSILPAGLISIHAADSKKPNIILFLVDDMGWQDTSLPFGKDTTELNRIYDTPNMVRLARKGMTFTSAYACPVSSPSRVSLFTGANASRHKVTNWTLKKNTSTDRKSELFDFEPWNYNGLTPNPEIDNAYYAKCLPELLKGNGYNTIMVGKAHFGAMDTPAADPLNIGFTRNIAGHAAGAMGSYLGEQNYGNNADSEHAKTWGVPDLEQYHGSETFLTEALTLEALKSIDASRQEEKPFFLYMSHYAVHAPFGTDKRYYDKYKAKGLSHKEAQFAGLVEGMDKSLGDLMDYLESNNLDKQTIILFMSDNGGYTIGRPDKNAPLQEGKGSLKEGGIREPMIVYWPEVTKPGSKTSCPVIIEDFFPTILEMAEIKKPALPQTVDGESFARTLKNKKSDSKRNLIFHYPNNWGERTGTIGCPQSAIIKSNWKLIHYYETGENELYDLSNDISETNNLAAANPKKTKELSAILSRKLKENRATRPIAKKNNEKAAWPDGTK